MTEKMSISRFLFIQKQVQEVYDQVFSAAAATCKLSRSQADVLAFLANNPQYDTAKDVALYRGFSKSYVSKAVDLLYAQNLISVDTNKHDRRFQNLRILAAAQPLVEILLAAQHQFDLMITQQISPEEKICTFEVLEKMLLNAEKAKA